jgi:hypothetical protein
LPHFVHDAEAGGLFTFESVDARHVHNSLSGNTSNRSTQWVETEAHAPLPTADQQDGPVSRETAP